jgi:hypothetical protein
VNKYGDILKTVLYLISWHDRFYHAEQIVSAYSVLNIALMGIIMIFSAFSRSIIEVDIH